MSGPEDDAQFMGMALRLAREGTGSTYPNPCVGAVVVREDSLVATGRNRMREKADPRAHAEMEAISAARRAAGTFTDTEGSIACGECGAGTFADAEGSISCASSRS